MLECMDIMANVLPWRYGKPKWPKLTEATEYFKVPFEETHRAVNDAKAAAQIGDCTLPCPLNVSQARKPSLGSRSRFLNKQLAKLCLSECFAAEVD